MSNDWNLKNPHKISNSSCASTHWNLKNLSKTNFFSPNSQLPESWQSFTLSNYNYLYLCLFPAWRWTRLFFSLKIPPITQPDSGTYNEASGNVGQQGHISIPSLSVVKEYFQLFFQQLLSCGNSLTLKAFAKRVQATLHGRMTSSWMKIIHSIHIRELFYIRSINYFTQKCQWMKSKSYIFREPNLRNRWCNIIHEVNIT